ncbi:FHIPEP family type III secretion protein, partial [Campylobacter jejuni]
LEIRLGEALSGAWAGEGALVMDRIAGLRRVHEEQFGLPFPAVRLEDGAGLGSHGYEIRLFGARYGTGDIHPDQVLAVAGQGQKPSIDGIPTTDPAFGLPAWWIAPEQADAAKAAGCTIIDPLTVLAT